MPSQHERSRRHREQMGDAGRQGREQARRHHDLDQADAAGGAGSGGPRAAEPPVPPRWLSMPIHEARSEPSWRPRRRPTLAGRPDREGCARQRGRGSRRTPVRRSVAKRNSQRDRSSRRTPVRRSVAKRTPNATEARAARPCAGASRSETPNATEARAARPWQERREVKLPTRPKLAPHARAQERREANSQRDRSSRRTPAQEFREAKPPNATEGRAVTRSAEGTSRSAGRRHGWTEGPRTPGTTRTAGGKLRLSRLASTIAPPTSEPAAEATNSVTSM